MIALNEYCKIMPQLNQGQKSFLGKSNLYGALSFICLVLFIFTVAAGADIVKNFTGWQFYLAAGIVVYIAVTFLMHSVVLGVNNLWMFQAGVVAKFGKKQIIRRAIIALIITIPLTALVPYLMNNTSDNSLKNITNKAISLTPAQKNLSYYDQQRWKISVQEGMFQFRYPSDWQHQDTYLSPQPIVHYEIGSVNAPVYYKLIPVADFDSYYSYATEKRVSADQVVSIGGYDFKRYDLVDSGTYEGESSGEVIIYVSPTLHLAGQDYHLLFHWEEKPALQVIPGNDPAIFDLIVKSLKFL